MPYLASILLIFLTILVHEGGHATVAWLLGVPIKEFAVGLPWPKKLTLKIGKVRISPIPLIAYVAIRDAEYYKIPLRKKIMIALAGPLANFAVGVIVTLAVLGPARGWYFASAVVNASVQSVGMLLTGRLLLTSLVSPVGLVAIGAGLLSRNLGIGIFLMWLILNFGIPAVNLLPIPALDGGQILMAVVSHIKGNTPEAIKGARLVTNSYFLVILAGIILLAIKDILGLF